MKITLLAFAALLVALDVPARVLVLNGPAQEAPKGKAARQPATRLSPAAVQGAVLYVASWCPVCRRARQYLDANGIRYTPVDIDTPDGRRAYAAAGGSGGIPFLVAGGRQVRGFSRATYDSIFKR